VGMGVGVGVGGYRGCAIGGVMRRGPVERLLVPNAAFIPRPGMCVSEFK